MRVVVGAQEHRTPIFADQITHIVFSPFWNVPPSIASEEDTAGVQRDPGYLARNKSGVVGKSGRVLDPTASIGRIPRAIASAAAGTQQLAWPREVHVPESIRRGICTTRRMMPSCAADECAQPRLRARRTADKARAYLLRDRAEWDADRIDAAMHGRTRNHVKLSQAFCVSAVHDCTGVARGRVGAFQEMTSTVTMRSRAARTSSACRGCSRDRRGCLTRSRLERA